MKQSRELADALAEKLELPGGILPGAGSVPLSGGRQALIEGQRGVLAYSPECVVVRLGRQKLSLYGTELRIWAMSGDRLLISGRVQRAEMEG